MDIAGKKQCMYRNSGSNAPNKIWDESFSCYVNRFTVTEYNINSIINFKETPTKRRTNYLCHIQKFTHIAENESTKV